MLFPALVILPGMIAVALAATGKDHYRLPPVQISDRDYKDTVETVKLLTGKQAGGERGTSLVEITKDSGNQHIAATPTEALGLRVHKHLNTEKISALLKDEAATPLSDDVIKARLQDAVTDTDYDGVILSLVKKYCPPGLMGLALTALLASFMSGMAGNVTAFNTVWTYDLYQAYIRPNQSDRHYMRMGGYVTVVGILLSIGCAYVANNYSNAMDILQLVFGFVNAPLFATFLLGMFWSRATSHGAFFGLVCGTLTSALFHGCTIAAGNVAGIKGAWIATVQTFPSEMAQNFWLASFAFLSCFFITVAISLATRRTKTDEELKGLVYSLTEKVHEPNQAWYATPGFLGSVLLVLCLGLNIYFW
jgi:SSS family solute:Na+ symporter